MAIALYISENQYFIGIFRVNGLEMLISLIYKSLTKMHAVFRAFRAIYNFVLHMLNFLVDTSDVSAWIGYETGVFSIVSNYDIACLYVTIEQNNLLLDSFSQPLYNGVPAIYNFAGYSTGEYIVTLSTADGLLARYRVTVVED